MPEPANQNRQQSEVQGPVTPPGQNGPEGSLPARFERVVQEYPDQCAVKTGKCALSYQALNDASNRLARAILARQKENCQPVGLVFGREAEAIVAMLGILKASQISVPLSSEFPISRLKHMAADAQLPLFVTNSRNLALTKELANDPEQIINLDNLDQSIPTDNPARSVAHDAPACILYTSGSTGEPKGVVWPHSFLLHYVWQNSIDYQISTRDRHSLLFPLSVGASMPDVFTTLLHGATLCLFDPRANTLNQLKEWLKQEAITFFHPPVALFRKFMDLLAEEDSFAHLRVLILGGDVLTKSDLMRFRRHFSTYTQDRGKGCILVNRLAGTEMGLVARLNIDDTIHIRDAIVPVGYPASKKEVIILDESGGKASIGDIGEIVIRSPYIALGYWRQTGPTRSKFRPDPEARGRRLYFTGDLGRMRPDGMLEHIGRKDSMVKLRGYRVDLGEIESALSALDDIEKAVVSIQDAPHGEQQLVAYLVPCRPDAPLRRQDALRQSLDTLPDYMLPARFVYLAALPLTPSGKVDRRNLPILDQRRPDLNTPFVMPRTPLEQQLAAVWKELLNLQQIGIYDDFFELGGHSLLALSLVAEIERDFDLKAPLKEFFRSPTVAQLAAVLDTNQTTGAVLPEQRYSALPSDSHDLSELEDQAAALTDLYNQIERPNASRHSKSTLRMGWHRRRRWASVAANWLPYPWVHTLLDQSLKFRALQQLLFHHYVKLIRRFLAVIESELDEKQVVQQSLLYGSLFHYRIGPWGRMRSAPVPQRYASQVETEGFEFVERSIAQQKGILLVLCHDNEAPWLSSINAKWSNDAVAQRYSIGSAHLYVKRMGLESKVLENRLYSQQLNAARQTLHEGGIVTIAGDGHHGRSAGLEYDFHGRRRPFRTGFAELALLTDAVVFAVFNRIDAHGKVHVRFVGPLDAGDAKLARDIRIQSLVDQYVALLHETWAQAPWMVSWFQMEKHLAYPPGQARPKPIGTVASHL